MQGAGWQAERIEEIPPRDASLGPAWHSIRHHFGILGARLTCDGLDTELGPGGVLYAHPEVRRSAIALEPSTLVVMVGGKRGQAYEVPDWDRDQPAASAS